jgi:hypothetical protein
MMNHKKKKARIETFTILFIYFFKKKKSIWPPPSGPQFLSLSSINYYDGNFHKNGNLAWYWWHAAATWIFSIVIYSSLWHFYQEYVDFRRQYFESKEYQRSMHARTLLIFNVPASMRSDEALTKWVDGMGLTYPAQQVCIGRQNPELSRNVEEHEDCVRKLESILSKYLNGKKTNVLNR